MPPILYFVLNFRWAEIALSVSLLATDWAVWDRIPVWGAIFSAPVQTDPGVHPASYTVGIGSFPEVKRPGHGVDPIPTTAEVNP